ASMRHLSGVLAVSECTASDIRANSRRIDIPVRVARPGVNRQLLHSWTAETARTYVAEQWGCERPFFLYVGAINHHKNIESLLRAFALLRTQTGSEVGLVLVGHRNWPPAAVGDLNRIAGVVHLQSVSNSALGALYVGGIALVQLSLYEGFGLPVLEAMSFGTPVLVSQHGSLPEVVGDAGVIVEPWDVSAVAGAMEELMVNPAERARRSQLCRQRAAGFSWETMARATIDLIEEVVSGQ
ncbi:MAG: glycosyltransferase family 4 protein, partial [Sulfobacillus sp.]